MKSLKKKLLFCIYSINSGGSRGGPPPSFLDQTEARRAEKSFLGTGHPPYLRVWIRHWLTSKSDQHPIFSPKYQHSQEKVLWKF